VLSFDGLREEYTRFVLRVAFTSLKAGCFICGSVKDNCFAAVFSLKNLGGEVKKKFFLLVIHWPLKWANENFMCCPISDLSKGAS